MPLLGGSKGRQGRSVRADGRFQMGYRKRLRKARKRLQLLRPKFRLFVFLMRHRNMPVDVLFRKAWKMVDEESVGVMIENNFRQIPRRHVLHHNFRQIFKYLFPSFSPEIIFRNQGVIDALGSQQSMIATIHSYSEYAISAALDAAGLKSAIITANPINPVELANYSFRTPPANILRTRGAFIEARTALQNGYILICDVDYVLNKESTNTKKYISTAIFDFQRSVKAQLFFAYTRIGEDGQIECIIERAGVRESAFQSATEFVEFIDSVQAQPGGMEVASWSVHMGQDKQRYHAPRR
jgi:hypothetical protein